jgi:GTP-binding protein HflX
VISDTVGFIRRLPDRLLASFESTLSEISEASLLLIVVDASDAERELHLRTILEVLEKLGASQLPRFYVFNKLDRLDAPPDPLELTAWSDGHPGIALSSRDPEAIAKLEAELIRSVRGEQEELTTFVPYSATGVFGLIYANCRVVASDARDHGLSLRIQGPRRVLSRIKHSLERRTDA